MILAGGSGTRLWPASRRARPKQLLPLGPNGESLLEAAIRRGRAVAGDRILIVTAESQLEATHALAPGIEMLAEPAARNTAAALGLAAAVIAKRDPDAVLVMLPADHHVANEPELTRLLGVALEAVERDDVIATIGLTPTRADTGFGYLEVDPGPAGTVLTVKRFVEKPDAATAGLYFASGRFLWNAGMFIAKARRLLEELDAQLPVTGAAVRAIAAGTAAIAEIYPTLPSISIDHAVMEKAARVVAVPAAVGWDDVGSWSALPALRGADEAGNTLAAPAVTIDASGNILMSDDGRRGLGPRRRQEWRRDPRHPEGPGPGRPQGRRRPFRAGACAVPMTREPARLS